MIDDSLVGLLRCPETGQRVALASGEILDTLLEHQKQGVLRHASGKLVKSVPEAGLLRADGRRVFPIRDGIPILLADEAIDIPG
jgi:uncharacterized protein YbaR (Trm112 family)